MHPLARAEGDDFAPPHLDAGANRDRFLVARQQYQDRVGGHGDKGDPRQFLFTGGQAEMVE
jgi:hypothetical protein